MPIKFHKETSTFHLYNDNISYILSIDEKDHPLHLYYGKRLQDKADYTGLMRGHENHSYIFSDKTMNNYVRKEYADYGSGDFREPSFEITYGNGSYVSSFKYHDHNIYAGKKDILPLPSTYVEDNSEADSLELVLKDQLTDIYLSLVYTIYKNLSIVTRHAVFTNKGKEDIRLEKAMSFSLDLADKDYEMIYFTGSWGRERHLQKRKLEYGLQSIYSSFGVSSAEQNPTMILKRPYTTESHGEAYGFALVYSGSFVGQVDVNTFDNTRVMMGIHPRTFSWQLGVGESFTTPEAILAYSNMGLNRLSQNIHNLFGKRLCRGPWRDRPRPILLNNWESTEMTFTEDLILSIAKKGAEAGVELFVLDDGWFGRRNDEHDGLGDWYVNKDKLPDGIKGLSEKVEAMGIKFGLWIEPEMVNKKSDLYKNHPEWVLHVPGRHMHSSRFQYVLDFSRDDVVDYLHKQLSDIIRISKISYIKWDMNRYLTEVYSLAASPENQGKVMHKFILGVYRLYTLLIEEFPEILFESCSSGGARFDPGMLFFAPQAWTSDNTDSLDRCKIQYGSSYFYPISSIGAHVSASPNHQTARTTSVSSRANVAYYGAFGYELNLGKELSQDEFTEVKRQIEFYKDKRDVFQYGRFYRLLSPFEGNSTAWISVSEDKTRAYALYYQGLNEVNRQYFNLKLDGLEASYEYKVTLNGITRSYYGDELMEAGIFINPYTIYSLGGDFSSLLIEIIKK